MAVTLPELYKNSQSTFGASVLLDFIRKNKIISELPTVTVQDLVVRGSRAQSLPANAKRRLGGGYTEATGTKELVEETLFIYGGDIEIDSVYTKVRSRFQKELDFQTQLMIEAINRTWNYDFIQGDHGVDPDGFEGLKKRVSNAPSRQTIDLYSGATLDVLASAGNIAKFVNALHKARVYLGGEMNFLFCNEKAKVGVGAALRQSGMVQTNKDAFDRTWDVVMGAKMAEVGLKGDLSTEIQPDTEGTGGDATSIYAAKVGDEEGLNVIALEGFTLEPYDPLKGSEKTTGPQFLRRIDYPCGLKNMSSNFSLVRITGMKFLV